ncbi:MAG: hypothetical protein LQ340_005070, partial [Diploschistes diacapsis]
MDDEKKLDIVRNYPGPEGCDEIVLDTFDSAAGPNRFHRLELNFEEQNQPAWPDKWESYLESLPPKSMLQKLNDDLAQDSAPEPPASKTAAATTANTTKAHMTRHKTALHYEAIKQLPRLGPGNPTVSAPAPAPASSPSPSPALDIPTAATSAPAPASSAAAPTKPRKPPRRPRPQAPIRSTHYAPLLGTLPDHQHVLAGNLHALPAQAGLPGFQRVSWLSFHTADVAQLPLDRGGLSVREVVEEVRRREGPGASANGARGKGMHATDAQAAAAAAAAAPKQQQQQQPNGPERKENKREPDGTGS